jgi:hypothetical protein
MKTRNAFSLKTMLRTAKRKKAKKVEAREAKYFDSLSPAAKEKYLDEKMKQEA